MEQIILVAIGGASGAVLRYLSVRGVGALIGETAAGTMFVNVVGSAAIGVAIVVLTERFPESLARLAPLVITGFLGGFTTFSAFSADTLRLAEDGRVMVAVAYIAGTVLLSLLGAYAGLLAARAALT